VPHELGIDAKTLHSLNPRLVYQYATSYGSTGPYARQPAIDPVVAAFAGQTAHQTGEGNPPLRESGADPVAAAGHAVAMMLGLFAAHRTGQGQDVESSMIVSNMYLNFEDALSYEGKPPRPVVDQKQFGISPTHRLYECAAGASATVPHGNPDPRWIMVAADDDGAVTRLFQIIGREDLGGDERFSTAPLRLEHHEALEPELSAAFGARTAPEWEKHLLQGGVGCTVADAASHFAFCYEDAAAADMMVATSHPSLGGTYWRYAPVLQLSDTPSRILPYCDLGEHSRSLLLEHGLAKEHAEALLADGVVVGSAG
jgi:crotonobetainyl-CoA:carnitine CoA-transferase CaiB-like acyl-CoA transferase